MDNHENAGKALGNWMLGSAMVLLLPGSGIGSILIGRGWIYAFADMYRNQDDYASILNSEPFSSGCKSDANSNSKVDKTDEDNGKTQDNNEES